MHCGKAPEACIDGRIVVPLCQQVHDRAHRRSGFGPESKVPLVDFADGLIGVLR